MRPAGVEELDPPQLAPGFRAGGAHCGLKGGGKTDVGLVVCDAEAVTSSAVLLPATPRRRRRSGSAATSSSRIGVRAAVVNTGNANAETGEKGYADALAMCERAAAALGLEPEQVAVAETGTIGVPLPIEAVLPGIDEAAAGLSADGGGTFSDAIMTTDRWSKRCTLRARRRDPLRPGQGGRDDRAEHGDDALLRPDRRRRRRRPTLRCAPPSTPPSTGSPSTAR